jgi:nucleoside-diphosphate kinase
MIKPDSVKRGLVGEIIKRIEGAGFTIRAAKLFNVSQEQAETLYQEHSERDFYQGLVDFAMEGPALLLVLESEGAVQKVRDLIGATNPENAESGTIRGDLGEEELPRNLVHASDSIKSAEREIPIFFSESELV